MRGEGGRDARPGSALPERRRDLVGGKRPQEPIAAATASRKRPALALGTRELAPCPWERAFPHPTIHAIAWAARHGALIWEAPVWLRRR